MKNIRLLFLMFCLCCSSLQAQVGKVIVKETTKEIVKKSVKNSLKKSAAKSSSKKLTREVIEHEMRNNARSMASDLISDKARDRVLKQGAKEVFKSSGKSVGKTMVRERLKKEGLEYTGKEAIELGAKKSLSTETKGLMREAENHYARKTTNKVAVKAAAEGIENTMEHQMLSKALNKRALEEWYKLAGKDLPKSRILLRDIEDIPELARRFSKDPGLLASYYDKIGSAYRKDITLLRYTAYNSDHLVGKVYERQNRARTMLQGKNLEFIDYKNRTFIRQKGKDEVLGSLEGNAKDGYIIRMANGMDNNPLTNMYLLKNTTYVFNNKLYKTDLYGRVQEVTVRINQTVKPAGRAESYIAKVRNFKNAYDTQGNQVPIYGHTNDIAGHVVADSWGGESTFMNIVPQNGKLNGSGLWKSSEGQGLKLAQNGHEVVRTIRMEYPDKMTQRPSGFRVTQLVDGEIHNVNGQRMANVFFENIKDMKN